jgi:hypothetical protein
MTTPSTVEQLATAIGFEASHELGKAIRKIEHCLDQLTDEQVWSRPDESQNSIGNLILHLCGNLRQWIVSGLGGTKDARNRQQEFSERGPIPKADLMSQLGAVVSESTDVMSKLPDTKWLRVRRIQGFEVTGLAAVFSTVPHFRGHTQEIIFRTRCLLGDKFVFSWKPTSPEQGASA